MIGSSRSQSVGQSQRSKVAWVVGGGRQKDVAARVDDVGRIPVLKRPLGRKKSDPELKLVFPHARRAAGSCRGKHSDRARGDRPLYFGWVIDYCRPVD
jgi:hypothetical protein